MTPHKAVYGSNPKLLPTYTKGSTSTIEVDDVLHDHQQIQTQLCNNLQHTQARMRKYAKGHYLKKVFKVGEWLWAKFHHYRQ